MSSSLAQAHIHTQPTVHSSPITQPQYTSIPQSPDLSPYQHTPSKYSVSYTTPNLTIEISAIFYSTSYAYGNFVPCCLERGDDALAVSFPHPPQQAARRSKGKSTIATVTHKRNQCRTHSFNLSILAFRLKERPRSRALLSCSLARTII